MLLALMFILIGLVMGLSVGWLSWRWQKSAKLWEAKQAAEEIMQNAKIQAQEIEESLRVQSEELQEEIEKRLEQETRGQILRNEKLQIKVQEKEKLLKEELVHLEQAVHQKENYVQRRTRSLEHIENSFRKQSQHLRELQEKYCQALLPRTSLSAEAIKEEIFGLLERESKTRAVQMAQVIEQETQESAKKEARRIIELALGRFPRSYCPERGIGNVNFANQEQMQRVLGTDRSHLKQLEKACGVDISINNEYLSASVLGFDPVRRELGRASLEKMLNAKTLDSQIIEDIVLRTKKDLFRKIRQDGERIASELRLKGLHQEIKNMMGALRYRYSFAQNQYFHCTEVGWLCGLLAGELGLDIMEARRAGMLHDIGKAMDHSKDGGHAVIGADFIDKHGESAPVVHAVRAHHYDETPATDLAYLVIAADALSGARPGARRSTMDSYSQKMADLEKIGNSFDGVLSTYILSAGREVRVVVDSRNMDDHKALELSQQVAHKIEEECSYPGLIKVTVVRETQAVEYAR